MIRLGIDLGGTKIEIIALDDAGRELLRRRVPTPRGDYEGTLRAVTGLVRDAETELGERGSIGIGAPGAVSPATGLMKNANSVCLIGKPVVQDLASMLERPILMSNDANCFALSEAVDGAGAGAAVVFGVIVGTGTGAGVVVHGRVLTGPNAIAGEWGHNPLPWPLDEERPGPSCYCGKHGCIETFLSGPGMARDHERATGERLEPAEIAARASQPRSEAPRSQASHPRAQGDAACEAALRRYEDRMARSLAHVINILDPDVIVLGGGMSNISRLYENVPRLWGRYVFSDRVDTRLVPPMHGDSSGVRGAAWLAGP